MRAPPRIVSCVVVLLGLTVRAAAHHAAVEMPYLFLGQAEPDAADAPALTLPPSPGDSCRDLYHHATRAAFELGGRMWEDATWFYGRDSLLCLGLSLAVAAPLANTNLDQQFRDAYQRRLVRGRNPAADQLSDVFKGFGDHFYTVPAYIAFGLAGLVCPDNPVYATLGEYGERSLRALAVGAPAIGILQVGLGAGRPEHGVSAWRPFRYNRAVSGHAFVGAIPFLTAAALVEAPAVKVVLVAASLSTAWSRLHDDDHYLSQVVVGWTIAYLAVHAVQQTEDDRMRLVPLAVPGCTGVGMEVTF